MSQTHSFRSLASAGELLSAPFMVVALASAALGAGTLAQGDDGEEEPIIMATPVLDMNSIVGYEGYFTGHVALAAEYLLQAVEGDPTSHLVRDGVRRLWNLEVDGESDFSDASVTARYLELSERVTDAEASYWLRRIAHRRLSRTRYSPDAPSLPKGLYNDFITQWHVVGPLGSFDAPLPGLSPPVVGGPDDGLGLEEGAWPFSPSFPAADGTPRSWVPAQRESGSAFVPVARSIYPQAGLTFAVAFVLGPDRADGKAVRAVLELRCSGAIQAWWNGRLAADESDIDPYAQSDRHLAAIDLQPGWNALLVRVPTAGPSAVAARVLSKRGGHAIRLDEPPSGTLPSEVPWTVTGKVDRIESFDLSFPTLSGPFTPAMRVLRAIHARRYDVALAVKPPKEDADPWAQGAFKLQMLAAIEGAQHLPEEISRRRLLLLLDETDGWGVEVADARWARFRLELGADRPLEALKLAEAWVSAEPDLAWPLYARCLALSALDPRGTASREALKGLLERFPTHLGAREMLMGSLRYEGASVASLELAWETLMTSAGSSIAMEIVLGTLGGTEDARLKTLLERAKIWSEQHPGSGSARRAMDDLVDACADPAARAAAAQERAGAFPMRPESWRNLAQAKLAVGDREGALASLAQGLRIRPSDRALRGLAARLGWTDPAATFFGAFAPDVSEALRAAESFGETSVIEALDLGLIYYFEDGSFHSRSHTLTVPTDRVGAESLLKRPANEDTQSIRVLRKGGGVLEPALTNGEWVLPSLEIGDVVEEVWDRRQGSVKGRRPARNSWRFASFEKAFAISRWVVFVPSRLAQGRFEVRNFEGTHEEIPFEGGIVHVFTDSQDRQVPEPGMPSYEEILPLAGFGVERGRDDELRAWGAQVERASSIPADLEQGIQQFVDQHGTAPGALERARALYAALDVRQRTFEGDEDAANAWLTRRGWPLYLLAAMYERADVPFRWVMLERPLAPELDPEPLTLFGGERPLARAVMRVLGGGEQPADGGGFWVIPGSFPGMPFGLVDDNFWGVSGWELPRDGESASFAPIVVDGGGAELAWDANIQLSYAIQADGSALVDGKVIDATPGGIVSMRQVRQATVEQREALSRNQAASVARGVDILAARVVLDGSAGPGVVVIFNGRIDTALEGRGDGSIFRLPFLPLQLGQRFGPAARGWPLALRSPARLRCEVLVSWPEGIELVGVPEAVEEARDGIRAALTQGTKTDRSVSFQQVYEQRGAVIAPEEMPAFVAAMARLEAEFVRPLRFSK